MYVENAWLVPFHPAPQASAHLVCLPPAGGGAATFRDWGGALGDEVAVWGVRLPGRERRLNELPCTDLDELVDGLVASVELLPPGHLFCFGHCGGALIAYELVHRLLSEGRRRPCSLLVSAQVSPTTVTDWNPVHDLPMEEFVEYLRSIGGIRPELLANERMMRALAPAIRADLRLAHGYAGDPTRAPLDVPVVAFGGKEDEITTAPDLFDWHRFTRRQFSLHLLPGDHWILVNQRQTLLDLIGAHLREQIAAYHGIAP